MHACVDVQAPELLHVSALLALQRVLIGTQLPPHMSITHAYMHVAGGVIHSPLAPQVWICVLLVQRWLAGTHEPPQAVPEQTYVQLVDGPHWPSLPHVCIWVLFAHCVARGVQMPPQLLPTPVPTQACKQVVGLDHCPLGPQF